MVLSKFISADDECPVNSVAVISGMRKKHVTPAHSHIQPVLNAFLAWEEDIVDLQHPDASAGDPHIPAHVDCCLKAGTYKEWTLQGNKDLPGKSVPRSGSLALVLITLCVPCDPGRSNGTDHGRQRADRSRRCDLTEQTVRAGHCCALTVFFSWDAQSTHRSTTILAPKTWSGSQAGACCSWASSLHCRHSAIW